MKIIRDKGISSPMCHPAHILEHVLLAKVFEKKTMFKEKYEGWKESKSWQIQACKWHVLKFMQVQAMQSKLVFSEPWYQMAPLYVDILSIYLTGSFHLHWIKDAIKNNSGCIGINIYFTP